MMMMIDTENMRDVLRLKYSYSFLSSQPEQFRNVLSAAEDFGNVP